MQDDYKPYAEQGIITPAQLAAIINAPDVKILDCSFVLPNTPTNPHNAYLKGRIENAAFFDIDDICDKNSNLPHMLPQSKEFESAVNALGINNDDLVVIYGQSGMVMGPARAWWMFQTFGHDNVCVLNGGLPAWKREGLPINTAPPSQIESSSDYKTEFHIDMVATLRDIKAATQDDDTRILDARPNERFTGQKAEPREELRSGHMPSAESLPCTNLINPETGMLKPAKELEQILNVDTGTNIITTCGSGVTACVIALALHNIGHKNIPVYDGSWSEYGQSTLNTEVVN